MRWGFLKVLCFIGRMRSRVWVGGGGFGSRLRGSGVFFNLVLFVK